MPTLSPQPPADPHQARRMAESFGADPARYDRTRPRYPRELVDAIIGAAPGRDFLDVGIGTGVSARPFQVAGCQVLGVEVDHRMAHYAGQQGFAVEVAPFEEWDPTGRTFDAIIAGMTWHWVDPAAGSRKAAALLRPAGRLAVFWNIGRPPAELAHAFSDVYRRVVPDSPFAGNPVDPLSGYERILNATAEGIRHVGGFTEPERWRLDWEQDYTTEQWVDQVPTFGGHSDLPAAQRDALLAGIAAAIDAHGGRFTMRYATVAVTAACQTGSHQPPCPTWRAQPSCAQSSAVSRSASRSWVRWKLRPPR